VTSDPQLERVKEACQQGRRCSGVGKGAQHENRSPGRVFESGKLNHKVTKTRRKT
jgi:hypothetical protein